MTNQELENWQLREGFEREAVNLLSAFERLIMDYHWCYPKTLAHKVLDRCTVIKRLVCSDLGKEVESCINRGKAKKGDLYQADQVQKLIDYYLKWKSSDEKRKLGLQNA